MRAREGHAEWRHYGHTDNPCTAAVSSCVLHVGMHKTGTSSIQASLAALPDDRGYKLAVLGPANASETIVSGFQRPDDRKRATDAAEELLNARRKRAQTRLRTFLQNNSTRNIVISAEAMVHLTGDELDELLTFIPHETIKVIGYVREPRSFMSSACQERVKSGMHDLETARLFPHYRTLFGKFVERLPTELYHFDPARLRNACVVQDFCARAGIDIKPDEVVNRNEALCREAIKLLYCWNIWRHAAGLTSRKSWVLPAALIGMKGVAFRLAEHFTKLPVRNNAAAIAWVENLLGSPFRSDLPGAAAGAVCAAGELREPGEDAMKWLCQRVGKRFAPGMGCEIAGLYMQLLYEERLLQTNGKAP